MSRAGEVQGAQAADRSRGKASGSMEQDVRGAGEGLALTCNVRSLLLILYQEVLLSPQHYVGYKVTWGLI